METSVALSYLFLSSLPNECTQRKVTVYLLLCVVTGHKPNPFLKAVPEDKNGEKNKTSSE